MFSHFCLLRLLISPCLIYFTFFILIHLLVPYFQTTNSILRKKTAHVCRLWRISNIKVTMLPKTTHRISAVNIIKMPVAPCPEIEKLVLNDSGSHKDLEYLRQYCTSQCIRSRHNMATKNRHSWNRGPRSHLILYL